MAVARTDDPARLRAHEAVAARFSRTMNACTSPLGVATDLPIVAAAGAVTVTGALLWLTLAPSPPPGWALWLLALAPFGLGALATLALAGARTKVVAWLAAVPFPVENVNGLLNGVAQNLRVRFVKAVPGRAELDEGLARVHEDSFVLDFHEEEPEVELRIGVLDSKVNPSRSNHLRYCRVRRIVAEVLVPLHEKRPIESVRIC